MRPLTTRAVDAAIYSDVGRRVRAVRKKRGMCQADLGVEVGLTRASICHIENGRACTTLGTLHRIAQALACDLDTLLAGVVSRSTNA